MIKDRLKASIREIKDFPKEGINFKDITPILHDPKLCADLVDDMANHFKDKTIDVVLGVESRGFLFGMMLAQKLQAPFVTARKKGKLPYKTVNYSYDLEYGTAELEVHHDSIKSNQNVLIHDDLLATGGTAAASAELVKLLGGNIAGFTFVIELSFLNGVKRLKNYSNDIYNLVSY